LTAPFPRAGAGVHRALLGEANRCRSRGLTPEAAEQHLRDLSSNCGRAVPPREIAGAVRKAFNAPNYRHAFAASNCRAWPKPDDAQIKSLPPFGLADLWELSPIRFETSKSQTEFLVDQLFPGDPLICAALRTPKDAITQLRSGWRGRLASCSLIVSSPMTALLGTAQDGGKSRRCLGNTGPRRFLVIEFDSGDLDSQAARIWHLAARAPLTLVTHSGGKSLHAWFYCAGQPEARLRRFMQDAVTLGADPATWCRCQLVRMPDGVRDDGSPQRCYYFNPRTIR
jgi:hypothetical protein